MLICVNLSPLVSIYVSLCQFVSIYVNLNHVVSTDANSSQCVIIIYQFASSFLPLDFLIFFFDVHFYIFAGFEMDFILI